MRIEDLVGVVLLTVQATMVVLMIRGLIRDRSGDGVSLLTEMIWIAGSFGWLLYSIQTGNLILGISGSLGSLGSLINTVLVWRAKRGQRVIPMVSMLALFMIVISSSVAGLFWISLSLSIFGSVQFFPQIVTSLRALKDGTGGGSPLGGTITRILFTGSWAVWSLTGDRIDYPLLIWGSVGAFAFLLQLVARLRAKS